MPGKKKLEEEYKKISDEEIKEEIKQTEEKLKQEKYNLLKFRLRKLRNDLIFILISSVILGFILWSWLPGEFAYTRALALGLAWYMLFEEMKLHKMFKKE